MTRLNRSFQFPPNRKRSIPALKTLKHRRVTCSLSTDASLICFLLLLIKKSTDQLLSASRFSASSSFQLRFIHRYIYGVHFCNWFKAVEFNKSLLKGDDSQSLSCKNSFEAKNYWKVISLFWSRWQIEPW